MARIVAFTVGDRRVASSRLRVYQFEDLLRRAGWELEVIPARERAGGLNYFYGRQKKEEALLAAARKADVVWIQKRLFRPVFLRRVRKIGCRIVYDFDDAVFLGQKKRDPLTRRRVRTRFAASIRMADLVLAGNRWLAEQSAAGEKAVVLPTAVDIHSLLPRNDYQAKSKTVVGWIGSSVNFVYLEQVAPVLVQLSQEGIGVRLLVVADRPFEWPGLEVENRRWSLETEGADVRSMDIGIMPLGESDWVRGKCAYKALQYMACGVPAVCSDFGAVKEIVRSGINGFLCASDREWRNAIRELARSPELRRRVGRAGRDTVEKGFSLEVIGARLVESLKLVLKEEIATGKS